MPFNVHGTIPWDYTVDSINASGKTLVALDKPEFRTTERSLVCYVATVGDCFRLEMNSSLTADGITIVTAAGGTGRWIRLNVPNQEFFPKTFWAIDPVSGNDENQGWGASLGAADLVPLKTLGELDRRLSGHPGYTAPCVYHVLNDIPSTDQAKMRNIKTMNGVGYPVFLGKLGTPLFSGTITGWAAAVPASNTGYQMTITGIPISWTASGLVGKMIQNTAGTKRSFVLKDLGSKTALVKQPMIGNGNTNYSSSSAVTNFTNGEAVEVYNLYVMPSHPFIEDNMFVGSELLEVRGYLATGDDVGILGASSPRCHCCVIKGISWNGTTNGVLSNCLFLSSSSIIYGSSGLLVDGCAILNTTLEFDGGTQLPRFSLTQVNSQTILTNAACMIANSSFVDYATFNSFADSMTIDKGASLMMLSSGQKIYGTNNTGYIFNFAANSSQNSLPSITANCTAISAQAKPISAAGVNYAYADLPIIDVTKNCIVGVV